MNSGIQLCKSASPLQLNFPLLGFQLADDKGEISYGGIAQLGERLNGIQEVSGSIPLISTTSKKRLTEALSQESTSLSLLKKKLTMYLEN